MPARSPLSLVGLAALLGFLLVTTASSARAHRLAEAPRQAELIELIGDRRSAVADLDEAVAQLRDEVAKGKVAISRSSAADEREAEEQAQLAKLAGTVALTGRGVVVQLSHSDRTPTSSADAGAYRINDADLQLVVNALLAAGADAVAINDSRLVSTTAIRAAGAHIVVNFRPLVPPFRVAAIGADRRAFESSAIAADFKRWSGMFGLGYTVSTSSEVTVPAYAGRVTIANAEPR